MIETVNHPPHYTAHPSGVECVDVAEQLVFNLGNCLKYAWRAGMKGDRRTDLLKALWYAEREGERRRLMRAEFEQRMEGVVRAGPNLVDQAMAITFIGWGSPVELLVRRVIESDANGFVSRLLRAMVYGRDYDAVIAIVREEVERAV